MRRGNTTGRWRLFRVLLVVVGLGFAVPWLPQKTAQMNEVDPDGLPRLLPLSVDLPHSPFLNAKYRSAPQGNALIVEVGVNQVRMWEFGATGEAAHRWSSDNATTVAVTWSSFESVSRAGMMVRGNARLRKSLLNPGGQFDDLAVAVDAKLPWAVVVQLLKYGLVFSREVDLLWMIQRGFPIGRVLRESDVAWVPARVMPSPALALSGALALSVTRDGVFFGQRDGEGERRVGDCAEASQTVGLGYMPEVIFNLGVALSKQGSSHIIARVHAGATVGCAGGVLEAVARLDRVCWLALE